MSGLGVIAAPLCISTVRLSSPGSMAASAALSATGGVEMPGIHFYPFTDGGSKSVEELTYPFLTALKMAAGGDRLLF